MTNFFGTLLANMRKVLTRFYLALRATLTHAISKAVFGLSKSLDTKPFELRKIFLARYLQEDFFILRMNVIIIILVRTKKAQN
jgi:hypothetical protein